MKTYSISELFNLPRAQIFALHGGVAVEIASLPANDLSFIAGMEDLRRIRRVLSRMALTP